MTAIATPTPIPAAAPAESPPFELEELTSDDLPLEVSEDFEDSDGVEVAAELPSSVELADRCVALGVVVDCAELAVPLEPAFSLSQISCNRA